MIITWFRDDLRKAANIRFERLDRFGQSRSCGYWRWRLAGKSGRAMEKDYSRIKFERIDKRGDVWRCNYWRWKFFTKNTRASEITNP